MSRSAWGSTCRSICAATSGLAESSRSTNARILRTSSRPSYSAFQVPVSFVVSSTASTASISASCSEQWRMRASSVTKVSETSASEGDCR